MTITHISDDPSGRREKYEIDKTEWGPGAWHLEPDWIQWRDVETGYPCLIRRNMLGAWCGYIAVSPGHPWYGVDREEIRADVHGGVSFAAGPDHVEAEPGDLVPIGQIVPELLWWVGFDCAHIRDLQPMMFAFPIPIMPRRMLDRLRSESSYRDQPYAEAMVRYLAVQAAEAFGR